jgi:hypothetical protein
MKRAIFSLLVVVFLMISTEANAACYTFEWTGFVERIEDGWGEPAPLTGVDLDDWFVATVTYETTAFGPGVDVIGDGLDYPAPPGLQMTYQFESGGVFSKDITAVRARKYVPPTGLGYCQWNWNGGDFGGLLFQANDWTHSAFDLPAPVLFDEMHTLFLGTLSMFEPASGNHLGVNVGPDDDRMVFFKVQSFSITPCTTEIEVAIDIKPASCPNPLNLKSKGVLPVAILGSEDFDVTQVDPASIRLEGIAPLRCSLEDISTPSEDCTEEGPDGFLDLTLMFDIQGIVEALGEVNDGDVIALPLVGNLLEEYDGTPIVGEDVVIILKKGK